LKKDFQNKLIYFLRGLFKVKDAVVYDPATQGISWAQCMHDQGIDLLCPKCGTKLIVALSIEEANQNKVHPGISCPKSSNHVFEMVNLVSARNAMSWFKKNDE
jgi:hypothetical protein